MYSNTFILFLLQLFAPTNAAWNAAATAERRPLGQLLSSRNVLRDILFSHIIPNRIIDASALQMMRSVTPQTSIPIFVVAPQPGAQGPDDTIGLISSGSNVRVIQPNNVVACNYVLHKINGVLRSSPSDFLGVNPAYTRAEADAAAGGDDGAVP
jgi:uncharacterized surface protein with fasciclin (FAS1) repeats